MNQLEHESFALELAESLQDTDSLPFYRRCVDQYPEETLRKTLARVLSIPTHKIKKTRGALFHSLLGSHAKKPSQYWP